MIEVVWGANDNKIITPIIRGAEKRDNNLFVIPLLNLRIHNVSVDKEAVNEFLGCLDSGKPIPVVYGQESIRAVLDEKRVEADINCIVGYVKSTWVKDEIVYAGVSFNDRPEAVGYIDALQNASCELDIFVPYLCNYASFASVVTNKKVNKILPVVSINYVTRNRPSDANDACMTVALVQSVIASNQVLNSESVILRGITPTEDGDALLIRIPELNNRRVFIGSSAEYVVLYFDAIGRAAIATKSELFKDHKAQASATQLYKLEYSETKVTIWFVNGNDTLNSAFPAKVFKPVTLLEMFGGQPYLSKAVPSRFRLPSCCGFEKDDVITVNGIRVYLVKAYPVSGLTAFEASSSEQSLYDAYKLAELFGDERNLICVKRTDVNRVEITVSQPMVSKTK